MTAAILSREDWQALGPETLFAIGHDGKYIACGPTVGSSTTPARRRSTATGSPASRPGTPNSSPTLYLVDTNKRVASWAGGALRKGTWRSKRFTLPQITGMSCIQVEASPTDDEPHRLSGLRRPATRPDPRGQGPRPIPPPGSSGAGGSSSWM
ncbi:MAG: hypothetical protein MZV65_39465 [Chromatiales bacterium]|nr:hypothetical protein [Chromatiales bacterium]